MLQSKYIKICAQYGLAIFCEKPVAMSPNESFQRRFDESYIALAEAISRGDIGNNPISAQIFFGDNPFPSIDFREGGNIFDNLCI
jgi:predicted dehydrogenase